MSIHTKPLIYRLLIGCITLTALYSCKDHDWSGVNPSSDQISYTLQTDAPDNRSRADKLTGCEIIALLDETSQDTLYLHPNIGDMPAPSKIAKKKKSRGAPIQNVQDFETIAQSFGVQAYTADGNQLYIGNGEVTKSGDLWIERAGERFWPGDGKLDFYCVAPYNAVSPDYTAVTSGTGKNITFAYEIPKSSDGTKDAEAQTDIMLAYAGGIDKTSNGGSVPTKFWHALAGIQFEVGDITGGTVQSITVRNVYGKGIATFDVSKLAQANEDDPEYPSFQEATTIPVTWTKSENAPLTSYTQSFDVKVKDQYPGQTDADGNIVYTGNQPVTDGINQSTGEINKKATFMLMPQLLTDQAEIEIEILGDETKEVHTLKAKISPNNNVEWKAGKIYTYVISSKSINWTYVFDVIPTEVNSELGAEFSTTYDKSTRTVTHGHRVLDFSYKVVSYRYRTNNPSITEDTPWTATGSKAVNDKQDRVAELEFADWMKHLTADYGLSHSGGREDDPEEDNPTYTTRMHLVTLVTDCAGDDFLFNATQQSIYGADGSEATPIDLSMHDVSGTATSTMNTANCYIVRAPGWYKIPLIYGNTMRNGATNRYAITYDLDDERKGSNAWPHSEAMKNFDRHDRSDIVDPWIKNNTFKADPVTKHITDIQQTSGILVWSDAYNLVSKIEKDANNNYLTFYVDPDYIQQGNAMVALRDDVSGDIIWSWHIWVTEVDYTQTISLVNINNANNPYSLAPASLGWCDTKNEWFTGRTGSMTFMQTGSSHEPITLTIKQLTANYESTFGNQTYYQFGRKDPFVGIMTKEGETKHLFYDTEDFMTGSKYEYITSNNKYSEAENTRVEVYEGIKNPNILFVGLAYSSAWGCDWHRHINYERWQPYTNLWNNKSLPTQTELTSKRGVVIKTVYDPSPAGFVIPPKDALRCISDDSDHSVTTFKSLKDKGLISYKNNIYTCYGNPNDKANTKIEFHATGQRWYAKKNDAIGNPGDNWANTQVYLWTADYCNFKQATQTVEVNKKEETYTGTREWAYSFYLIAPGIEDKDYPDGQCNPIFQGAAGMARPVRPIVDNRYSYK